MRNDASQSVKCATNANTKVKYFRVEQRQTVDRHDGPSGVRALRSGGGTGGGGPYYRCRSALVVAAAADKEPSVAGMKKWEARRVAHADPPPPPTSPPPLIRLCATLAYPANQENNIIQLENYL